ncbi:MAG: prephenate dehydrogenase/arogenate dehydrogenase family protein [Desulfobulbaceae bacterium]|nr:prephenate dehydrogenase/arogenate dehydrogenase family protein [Desulfobulbaceae bacterium]
MTTIATLGPEGSHAFQAARHHNPDAALQLFPQISAVLNAFKEGKADHALIPVYNTREGEIREYFHQMESLQDGHWIDNVVLPIHLALGAQDDQEPAQIVGTDPELRQCDEYLTNHFPATPRLAVRDIEKAIQEIKASPAGNKMIIGPEELLKKHGFTIRQRDVAPHSRTRFALLGKKLPAPSGYDATAMITVPLKDRVGLLFDTLGEFSKRGVNLLDLRSETDPKSQELKFYVEAEGHIDDPALQEALSRIESNIIQEPGAIKVLGSYPRLDMRAKRINTIGFIGTGDMSVWFAKRLESEGYKCLLTGRSTKLTPEEMIAKVELVAICVPISATAAAIAQYGPLLKSNQALVLLAGEAENNLDAAITHTTPEVEVMLVHNLWGPQAATMKDKNVSVVRTERSGPLCSEFEAFLYKHGADIRQDSANRHDLLMGVGQKLPTSISIAMGMALKENGISPDDIGSHSTLTSMYGILAMCRAHAQNPRTYAEIMAAKGDGQKIIKSFAENLLKIIELAESGQIEEISEIIDNNRKHLGEGFLATSMRQSLAVDEVLGKLIKP